MSIFKELFYDWMGGNQVIFWGINSIRQTHYDLAMRWISKIGEHENFPYYLGAIAIWVALSTLYRIIRRKKGVAYYISLWAGVFIMLGVGYVVNGAAVLTLKDQMHMPRPQIVFSRDVTIQTSDYFKGREQAYKVQEYKAADLHVLERIDSEDLYRSFPSGHVAFAVFLVVALWPVFSPFMMKAGVIWIILIAWSRVSVGAHFPSDVLGSILISTPLMLGLRSVLYRVLYKVFKLKC